VIVHVNSQIAIDRWLFSSSWLSEGALSAQPSVQMAARRRCASTRGARRPERQTGLQMQLCFLRSLCRRRTQQDSPARQRAPISGLAFRFTVHSRCRHAPPSSLAFRTILALTMLAAPACAQAVIETGTCTLIPYNSNSCAVSPGFPALSYGDNNHCVIVDVPATPLQSISFNVEPSAACDLDYTSILFGIAGQRVRWALCRWTGGLSSHPMLSRPIAAGGCAGRRRRRRPR
jgi:hypothetical protein